jgi:hypothetical protein
MSDNTNYTERLTTNYVERLNLPLPEPIARIDKLMADTQKKQREFHMQP